LIKENLKKQKIVEFDVDYFCSFFSDFLFEKINEKVDKINALVKNKLKYALFPNDFD
jgi:hypothetical protein